MAAIKGKRGFTIVELITTLAIITMFFITATMILAAGSKIYLKQTATGNAKVAAETIVEDMKNYIMYGEDIQIFYVLQNGRKTVADRDLSSYPSGSEVYLEKDASNYQLVIKDPEDDSQLGVIVLPNPANPGDPSEAEKYYGDGIDLGYKKIYFQQDAQGQYIKGLSYSREYYRNMKMDLRITDAGVRNPVQSGVYEIHLSGAYGNNFFKVKAGAAVGALNK